ncbi:MAG: EutN/CcmL family microcompartment protein [Planctomycetota bacterium]
MRLGRVTGRVVCTHKIEGLEGVRLVILQPLASDLSSHGASLVACDPQHAGPGDLVYWIGGREASMALREPFVPVDATVLGHVEL